MTMTATGKTFTALKIAERTAADPQLQERYPTLVRAVHERGMRLRALLARPFLADRIVVRAPIATSNTRCVDAQLRVKGIAGLRVADASIMPTLIGGNTNAPSIMIGEKAADLIRAAH